MLIVAAGSGAARAGRLRRSGAVALVASATALHAVPTDAEAAAEAPPLGDRAASCSPSGDFLGWAQVTRADGAVGWVRGADLVPLYGAVAAPRASGEATT